MVYKATLISSAVLVVGLDLIGLLVVGFDFDLGVWLWFVCLFDLWVWLWG